MSRYSDITKIIRSQIDINVVKVSKEEYETVNWKSKEQTILLFDAETEKDLSAIARQLKQNGKMVVSAGCAGFAAGYEFMLNFEKGHPYHMQKSDGLLALCGSVNQITANQINYAEKHGFIREHLGNEQKLGIARTSQEKDEAFFDKLYQKVSETDRYILDTFDLPGKESTESFAARHGLQLADIRFQISDSLGRIAMEMVNRGLNYTFSMTGGDTLMGFMRHIGKTELVPICEIGKGSVLSTMYWNGKQIQVISKSGGFGEEDIFIQMYNTIIHWKKGNENE